VEARPNNDRYGVAERRSSLFSEDSVQSINETHLQFALGHDPLFFVHVDQHVTVTALGPLLADPSRTASGDFVISSGVQPVVDEFVSQSATIAAFSGAGLGSLAAMSPSLAAYGPRVIYLNRMRACNFRAEQRQQVFVTNDDTQGAIKLPEGILSDFIQMSIISLDFPWHFLIAPRNYLISPSKSP